MTKEQAILPPSLLPTVQRVAKHILISLWSIGCAGAGLLLLIIITMHVLNIVKLQAAQKWPIPTNPVARFLTKIDWETRTIDFDASASKTFNNTVEKYIWRIDDGASSMDGAHFTHTFTSPGYYEILFSLVDSNGQSDQADCRILFPPKELEQIATSESLNTTGERKEVTYRWVPKGTFFNYSKLDSQTAGDLRSPFVETGCGFSNNSYNNYDVYENATNRSQILRTSLYRIGLGILFIPMVWVLYILGKKKLQSLSIHGSSGLA